MRRNFGNSFKTEYEENKQSNYAVDQKYDVNFHHKCYK